MLAGFDPNGVSSPRSLFTQNEIHHPAPADVRRGRVAAVVQYVLVVAAGILERVREKRHRAEVPRLVHPAGELHRGRRAPLWRERDRLKWVADDVPKNAVY